MKSDLPQIDLITVNYNRLPFLEEFFRSLNDLNYPKDKLRAFFVDNNSKDASVDFVKQLKVDFNLQIIRNNKNYGFAKANNIALPRCRTEYIALLDNDTKVDKNWLIKLVEKMQSDPEIGICDSKRIPDEAPRDIDPVTGETSWCLGGMSLVRKRALEEVGYFDERLFMYGEDNDLCWRMWLSGWKCVHVAESICEHYYSPTDTRRKSEKYHSRSYYYFVRNSILLRYVYGSVADIKKAYIRWIKECLHLALKKLQVTKAAVVFLALMGHILQLPHFLRKRRATGNRKSRWINL